MIIVRYLRLFVAENGKEIFVIKRRMRRGAFLVGIVLVGVLAVEPVDAVKITAPVRSCLVRTVGRSATAAIEKAKKLTAKQTRSLTACKKSVATPPTTTVPPTTTTTTLPASAVSTYDLDPALSAQDVEQVKDWTTQAVAKHQELFGIGVSRFTTNVSRSASWLANRDCRRHSGWATCVEDRTNLFGSTWAFAGCTPAPTDIECYQVANLANFTGDDYLQFKTFVHEVHHIVQDQWHRDYEATRVPSNTVRPIGPDWLIEGGAEFLAYYITSEVGKTTMTSARAGWSRIATGITSKLSSFETRDGQVPNVYGLYALAVDELLKMEGNSPKKLATYYQLLATKIGWQAAFRQAFGLAHDAFYSHFENVRPR
jgi:hypothetical protein